MKRPIARCRRDVDRVLLGDPEQRVFARAVLNNPRRSPARRAVRPAHGLMRCRHTRAEGSHANAFSRRRQPGGHGSRSGEARYGHLLAYDGAHALNPAVRRCYSIARAAQSDGSRIVKAAWTLVMALEVGEHPTPTRDLPRSRLVRRATCR